MLYHLIKIPARLAQHFYCRKIKINYPEVLHTEGPLLIASNHPNSFLDAIILATIFKHPVYSLTRGDVFVNKYFRKILMSLKMLPVYRQSEGAQNLEHNYTTFSVCLDIFKNNGIALIFSEGRCINEWHLRPLKKGTARLAINAWQQGIPLKILPVGINYSSFRLFGKNVIVNFGELIDRNDFDEDLLSGKAIISFNKKLEEQLDKLVIQINSNNKQSIKEIFFLPQSMLKKILLIIPAVIGYIVHFPLYFSLTSSIKKIANDHFDSIIIGALFFIYPFYLIALTLLIFWLTKNPLSLFLLLVFPYTAWAYLQLKKQI